MDFIVIIFQPRQHYCRLTETYIDFADRQERRLERLTEDEIHLAPEDRRLTNRNEQ